MQPKKLLSTAFEKKNLIYSVAAAVILAVVAVLFFAPADFEGKVLQQQDIQQGLANGHQAQEYESATGEKAYWTNSLFSGMPTFQISPSYDSNKMLEWVTKLYTLWLPSPANILFAMMLGFFIMCLCFRMRWSVALFGAIAWGFSTYFIIIIGAGHIWKFLTLAYIPPTIGGLVLIYRRRYWVGMALTSLFAALQLGSNHPQMTYYFLFVVGALVLAWLFIAFENRAFKQWLLATVAALFAGGLGVAANLASLYMSYEYSKETIRGKATELVAAKDTTAAASGLDYDYITQWSYGVEETMTLLVPNVKGGASVKPKGGDMYPKSVLDTDVMQDKYLSPQEQQFAYYFMQYFGDQPMTNGPVYVGAFVLMLALLAMFVVDGDYAAPVKWALFLVSILAILLAWGHNFESLTRFFIDNVPFYNKFRTPSSMLVVVEFCVPLLAAMAIVKMVKTPDFLAEYGGVFYTVMGLGAIVCLLGWLVPDLFGSPWSDYERSFLKDNNIMANPAYANVINLIEQSRLSLVKADYFRSLAFIVGGMVICILYFRGTVSNSNVFVCLLAALVLVDLFSVNKRYVDNDNFVAPVEASQAFEPTEADRQILADTAGTFRVFDRDHLMEARSSYFHNAIGGYHAAKLTRYNDLLDNQITKGNREVLNMLNTRYFIVDGKAVRNPDAFGNAWFVDNVRYVDTPEAEMQALSSLSLRRQAVADMEFRDVLGTSRQASPGDEIRVVSYTPNVIEYKTKSAKGGVAVFSEVFFPWGWEATVDGKPAKIGRVDYVLRALNVPAGNHTVRFEFNPKELRATNTLSVIAVSVIFLLCLVALGVAGWKGCKSLKRETE